MLAGLTTPPGASAQERPAPSRFWVGVGFGGGEEGSSNGAAAFVAQVVYQKGPHHLALRTAALLDPFGDGEGSGELGVLYGRTRTGRLGHATLAAGVSTTHVGRCASGSACDVIGLPVVGEAALRLARPLGIGLQAFVNLNGEATYGGVVVMLQLGWMP